MCMPEAYCRNVVIMVLCGELIKLIWKPKLRRNQTSISINHSKATYIISGMLQAPYHIFGIEMLFRIGYNFKEN